MRGIAIWGSIFLLTCGLLLTGCGSSTPSSSSSGGGGSIGMPMSSKLLETVASTHKLVIGTSDDVPWSYVTKSGEIEGVIPDMLRQFLSYEHVSAKLDAITMPFSSLIPSVQSGRIQIIADSMYKTAPREKQIDFTDVIFWNPPALVVQKGNPLHILTLSDLCGKSAGTYEGTVYVQNLQQVSSTNGKSINVKVFPTVQEVMAAVSNGGLAGALIDSSIAAYAVHQNPSLNIELVASYIAPDKAQDCDALGVAKGHDNFVKDFNAWVAQANSKGEIAQLFSKWGLQPTKYWLTP